MKDWRIDNVEDLRGLRLERQRYVRWSEEWDHDHCLASNATFMEMDGPGIQREGYATREDYPRGARYEWVCMKCFEELRQELGWSE